MKWNKHFLVGLTALVLIFSTAGCGLIQSMVEDKVLTTVENVKPEDKENAVPADLNLLTLPEGVREQIKESGKTLVIVDKDSVLDPNPTKTIDLTDDNEGALEGLIDIGLGVAGTVWPGVAALEAFGLLFSQRKRKHYGTALAKAAPVNGKVELVEAIVSLGRGLGLAHSSEGSKAAFKEGDPKITKSA